MKGLTFSMKCSLKAQPISAGFSLNQYLNIRNMKIQTRLILLFMLLSLLPMMITGFFSYQQSSMAIQNKINTYSRQIVNQVAKNIKVEMTRLENDTVEIGFSEMAQKMLIDYESMSEWEVLNAVNIMHDTLVKKFSFLHDVSDVLLFTQKNNRIIAYGEKGYTLSLKREYQSSLLNEIKNKNGVPVWKPIGWEDANHLVKRVIVFENGLIVGKAVKSFYEGEYIGAVVIRTNERFFADIYRSIDIGKGAALFVSDSKGVVVSTRTKEIPFQRKYKATTLISRLKKSEKRGRNVFNMEIGDKQYLVAFAPIENAGWYVISTIPHSYLNSESKKIRNRIIMLGVGSFLLAVLLSVIFTKSISKPLNQLIGMMNEVKRGNLGVRLSDENPDELGEVTRNFNAMAAEIENLLTDIKNKETQKRNAELKALQAQINPHFLSNVLNTAKLLANAQKAENLESLLTSLIQLLNVSMGKEDDLIAVRKEIQYLKNYLNIQEFRYYHKFQVSFEIEAELLDYKLPKFLLQPILENSIIHGIGQKKGQGIVEVKGFIYEGKMVFTITDDGVGMTRERIDEILRGDGVSLNRFCGIGIKNVQERIKINYGDGYGLRIDSYPNHFTTVEMTLPINDRE